MPAQPSAHSDRISLLYGDHHRWLRGWLRKKLGCSELAADLAHDTFLRIWGARERLADLAEPRAYLTATARRLLIDHARRQRIEQAYLDGLSAAGVAAATAPSAETVVAAVESLRELAAALAALPANAHEAFLLHYLEGESQPDIAARLGISVRMVQKHLARALLACHQALEH